MTKARGGRKTTKAQSSPWSARLRPRLSYYAGLGGELAHLVRYFDEEPKSFQAGEWIAQPALPLAGAHYIESGFVQATDDVNASLARRGILFDPGSSIGEYALTGAPPFPSYLRALTDVRTRFLSPARYREACKREGSAIARLVQRVESRVALNSFLPELIAALGRYPPIKDMPVHRLIDEAQLGTVMTLTPGRTLDDAIAAEFSSGSKAEQSRLKPQGPDTRWWFYIAEGALECAPHLKLPGGSVFVWGGPEAAALEAVEDREAPGPAGQSPATRLVRLAAGPDHIPEQGRAGRASLASGSPQPKVMIGFRCERDERSPGIPFSPLARLLAETLSKLPGVGSVGLWVVGPDPGPRKATLPGLAGGHVKVRHTTQRHIKDEQDAEDYVVIDAVGAGGRPADWVEQLPLTKLVVVGSSRNAPAIPLMQHLSRPTHPSRDSPDVIRSIILRADAPLGEYVAYQPGTIRLAFDDLARLETFASGTKLPTRDRRSLERLARAIVGLRVGVALGGGGAWGYAHIALLQELENVGMPVDVISGVSFGSLVAGFYAAGGTDALPMLIDKGTWLKGYLLASGFLPLPNLAHHYIDALLDGALLEYLEIPCFPIGLDVNSAEEWSVARGTVGLGIRAASAMPGLLPPVIDTKRGIRSVDGSFVNNVPEGVLLRERADIIIASDVVEPMRRTRESWWTRIISVVDPRSRMEDNFRATAVLMQAGNDRDGELASRRYRPPPTAFSALAFDKAWDITESARESAAAFARETVARYNDTTLVQRAGLNPVETGASLGAGG